MTMLGTTQMKIASKTETRVEGIQKTTRTQEKK